MKPGILKSKSTEDYHYQVIDDKLKPFQALLKEANGSEEILSLLNSKIPSTDQQITNCDPCIMNLSNVTLCGEVPGVGSLGTCVVNGIEIEIT